VLNPSTMLYTPAGFLVVEQVMNNADVEGIRWVAMPTEGNTAPFEAMVKLLQQPLDGAAVPASMQLMMKVHAVLSAPAPPKTPSKTPTKAILPSPARARAGPGALTACPAPAAAAAAAQADAAAAPAAAQAASDAEV
jgi:hypothetical protein